MMYVFLSVVNESVRLTISQVISSPTRFLDSEFDEDVQMPQWSAPLRPVFQKTHIETFPGRSPPSAKDLSKSPLPHAKDQGHQMTPKARLRHNDSQVLFTAIDSSPLQPDEVESQMLTDRQKEVRQRQVFEATTMFPNLGIVPKPKDQISGTTNSHLHIAENEMSSSPMDIGDNSPISYGDIPDDVLGSSPTPRSSIGKSRLLPAIQPPSTQNDVAQISSSFDVRMTSWLDETDKLDTQRADKHEVGVASDQGTQTWDPTHFLFGNKHPDHRVDSSEALMNQPTMPQRKLVLVTEPAIGGVDAAPHSDNEVFVDAQPGPPSPSENTVHQVSNNLHAVEVPPPVMKSLDEVTMGGNVQEPVTPLMHYEARERFQVTDVSKPASSTSQIIDSFEDAETHPTPNEDDQIAAQLVKDLERASSQVDGETAEVLSGVTCPRGSSMKRKSAPEDSEAVSKKVRLPEPRKLPNFQIVVDSRQSSGADFEFVTLDAHARSRPSPRDAKLGKARSRSKRFKVPPKSTGTRNGAGRPARSSSADPTSEHESCGVPDETSLSALDLKHDMVGHLPVARRRRSARLNGSPPASQPFDLPGSDAASLTSEARFATAVVADVSNQAEPSPGHSNSTEWQERDDRGAGSLEIVSSSRKICTESAASDLTIPNGVTGFHNPPADGSRIPDSFLGRPSIPGQVGYSEEDPDGGGLSARGILCSFRNLLENIKRVTLGAEEERELVRVLVDSVQEVHEAGRRHGNATI